METTQSNNQNYENVSMDKLKELFDNMKPNKERGGFILLPEIDGFTVYTIEEKTLSKLLRMVEYVRRNNSLFEPSFVNMQLNQDVDNKNYYKK